jgi:Bacterial PH domain
LGKELSARVEFLSGILPPLCGPQLWTREESFPNARVSSLTSDGIFGVGLSSDRKRTLRTGEQAVFCVGSHWILIVGPCCAGLFFGIASFTEWLAARSPISAKDGSAHGYFVLALVALRGSAFLGGWLRYRSSSLTLTSERVIAQQGFLLRRSFEVPLARLAAISVEESLTGRILGYGTIVVRGTTGGPERFRRMRESLEFSKQSA